ncbi:MAG: FIST C-terminal domain-containing protein [Deferribacteraceae bacterium]|jgi:hypothetical protein|nr:FIST C-terminal domain-containing protein [Deferribacteraceae bacterium]
MIKLLFAHTMEVDDPKAAVAEILGQLEIEKNLLKNSVGIFSFHREFAANLVLEALDGALPFELAGISTISSAVRENYGEFILTLTVLTSDDVIFSAGMSDPLGDDINPPIEKLYNECAAKLPGKASFIFSCFPFSYEHSGEKFVASLDEITGEIPNFGAVALDIGIYYRKPLVSFGGFAYEDRAAIILFYGDVRPSYSLSWPANPHVIKGIAFLTKSDGHYITEINAMPAANFFYNLELLEKGDYIRMSSIMLIVENPEFEEPVCMVLLGPLEDGSFFCSSSIPVGSCISIVVLDREYALSLTEKAVSTVKNRKDGVMLFSCSAYYIILELDTFAGIKTIESVLGDSVPYFFAYSGGEICPSKAVKGGHKNRFHNASIIALSFD